MNPHIFREYDIRGIAGEDLTDEVARNIGRAFGTLVRREGGSRVVLGHDVRDSSPRLHEAVAAGLVSAGVDVDDLGFIVTPGGYFASVERDADGSLQVTGSHNPPEYNGFKMTLAGAAVYGDAIQGIRRIIEEEDYEEGEGRVTSNPVDDVYFAAVTSRVTLKGSPRIVVDAGNGTAGPMARRILEALGCEVDCLYCEPDASFPNHLPDPTIPEYMEDLVDRVKETGAEVGMGFDG
ncbi:MAG: phosphomannomutase, partial [bacterium]